MLQVLSAGLSSDMGECGDGVMLVATVAPMHNAQRY